MAIDRVKEQQIWQGLHPKVKRGVQSILEDTTFKDGQATHNKTGEDVTHLVDIGIKTTQRQVRALEGNSEIDRHTIDNGGFIIAFFTQARTIEERFPTLTKQDTARLMYIGTFIAWETNRLQSDNGKKHYTKKDLEELVEMSTKRFNELFKRLENEGIIHEEESGEIFINPTVFYRGKVSQHKYDVSELIYTRMFKDTVRNLYAQYKGRTLGQLAIIYSVLPFLNFNTNIICYNPEETSEDLIRPMSLDKLAALLGYVDASSLKRSLNRIKVDGKPVFGFFENPYDRRKWRIIVNPRVVFAGDGEALKAINVLFN